MYLYIFKPLRWFRVCTYKGAAITTTFYIATTVAMFYFTTPRVGETWAERLVTKEFNRSKDLPVVTASFGVVIDLVILLLPMFAIMPLQSPKRRKIGLICVFMTGLL